MSVENNENERYARADVQGGYLYNRSEIDYFKQTQAIDVMNNLMLGDFNKKGAYVIEKGIIDELVKVKKIYQYSFGSTTFCQSVQDIGGYGKIDFAIKMRNNTQNKTVTATLQLLETIDRANGYYQNTNTASIAVYTAQESNHYIVDMLKYFNVVSKKEDGLLRTDRKEEDVDLIVARRKYETLLKNNVLGKLDDLNKGLFQKRLKILQKSAVGKKILEQFNSETYKINGWFVKEGMPGYYRYLNQMLDGLMELHSVEAMKDAALMVGWRKFNADFANEANRMMSLGDKMMANSAMMQEDIQVQRQRQLENELKKDLETVAQKTPEENKANIPQTPVVDTPKVENTPKFENAPKARIETFAASTGGNGAGANGNGTGKRMQEKKQNNPFGNIGKHDKRCDNENNNNNYEKPLEKEAGPTFGG